MVVLMTNESRIYGEQLGDRRIDAHSDHLFGTSIPQAIRMMPRIMNSSTRFHVVCCVWTQHTPTQPSATRDIQKERNATLSDNRGSGASRE
jgi:hypothetical protein